MFIEGRAGPRAAELLLCLRYSRHSSLPPKSLPSLHHSALPGQLSITPGPAGPLCAGEQCQTLHPLLRRPPALLATWTIRFISGNCSLLLPLPAAQAVFFCGRALWLPVAQLCIFGGLHMISSHSPPCQGSGDFANLTSRRLARRSPGRPRGMLVQEGFFLIKKKK